MHWNKTQNSDGRAVSPVIGVIMMVAVTVILAAIVSMLVLGMGSDLDVAPQASFGFEYDSAANNVTISHEGGDALDVSQLQVKVGSADSQAWPGSGDLTAGDSAIFAANSTETVRVIWVSDTGDSTILATYKVP